MAAYSIPSAKGTEANITSSFAVTNLLLSVTQPATPSPCVINEVAFGPSGAPNATDCSIEYAIMNTTTAAPTGGTAVIVPDNAASRAANAVGMVNGTGGATLGTVYSYSIGLNQRASYRWTAIPGQELVVTITTLCGLSLLAKSATYASTIGSVMHVVE